MEGRRVNGQYTHGSERGFAIKAVSMESQIKGRLKQIRLLMVVFPRPVGSCDRGFATYSQTRTRVSSRVYQMGVSNTRARVGLLKCGLNNGLSSNHNNGSV